MLHLTATGCRCCMAGRAGAWRGVAPSGLGSRRLGVARRRGLVARTGVLGRFLSELGIDLFLASRNRAPEK